MPKKQLRELLDQLDLELDTVHRLDESGREKMKALRAEMQQVLERTAPERAAEDEGLLDRLREARDEFGAEHPALTRLLNRIAQTLSNMGI
jgi:hypothetical protein